MLQARGKKFRLLLATALSSLAIAFSTVAAEPESRDGGTSPGGDSEAGKTVVESGVKTSAGAVPEDRSPDEAPPPSVDEDRAVEESELKIPAEVLTRESPEPAGKDTDPIGDYLDAIRAEEVRGGAYSRSLADLYLGLGNQLLRDGQYLEARDAYRKGMQVTRINDGLNSLSQEPFLFSLANLDHRLGDLNGSNQALNHILQINSDTYGPGDERMLPVLNRMLDWYLANYRQLPPNQGLEYLSNSEKLANQIVLIHMDTLDLNGAGAGESFRKMSAVEFALARHISTYGLPGEEEAFSYSFGAVPNQVVHEPSVVDSYYRRGRDALKTAVKLMYDRGDASNRELARAVTELADWYAAFDKHFTAEEHYLLAYQLLGEDEETRELQSSYFAEPRLITFDVNEYRTATGDSVAEGVEITLDITDRGVPRNLRLDDEGVELGVREIKRIKREVMNYRFRPQMVDGAPVETRDYVFLYPLESKGEGQHES